MGEDDEVSSSSSSNSSYSSHTHGFTLAASTTSRAQQRRKRRPQRKKKRSQHTLDYKKQHISKLMSIFETNGWFIPVLESMPHNHKTDKKGKVWSNRNYGADKKRQRKICERQMLEARIEQLESVLRLEHGVDEFEEYEY